MPPKRKRKTRIQKENSKPFQDQKRTYLQGTILRLFEYHCAEHGLKAAEYLRQLVIQDLKTQYELNATGGVVKIKQG